MSRKSERLVNLTIALLTAKRYLTKSEIFEKIEGYEGEGDARDRMFERDKDELRSIGITIEVGTIDPFFEDELGYRITPSTYSLQIEGLSSQELTLIWVAQKLFASHSLQESTQSALLKLQGLGLPLDENLFSSILSHVGEIPFEVGIIVEAISQRSQLTFTYIDEELRREERTINPLHLHHRNSRWYVIGRDCAKDAIRTFRLDRIEGGCIKGRKAHAFDLEPLEIAALFMQENTFSVTFDLRPGTAHQLVKGAILESAGDEWNRYTRTFVDNEIALREFLLAGSDVRVIGPESLRLDVIEKLKSLLAHHG